jgi:hypothetical protein
MKIYIKIYKDKPKENTRNRNLKIQPSNFKKPKIIEIN